MRLAEAVIRVVPDAPSAPQHTDQPSAQRVGSARFSSAREPRGGDGGFAEELSWRAERQRAPHATQLTARRETR